MWPCEVSLLSLVLCWTAPLVPGLPSNAGRGGHKKKIFPFLPITSVDPIATRQKKRKIGTPLAFPCMPSLLWQNILSLQLLFFSAEITVMWNHPPCILAFFLLLSPFMFPYWKHPHHCHGSECEPLIKLWLLSSKRSSSESKFPQCRHTDFGWVFFFISSQSAQGNRQMCLYSKFILKYLALV